MVDYRTLCVGCEAMASRRLESRGRALLVITSKLSRNVGY